MRRNTSWWTQILVLALVASTLVLAGPDPAFAQALQANDDTAGVAAGSTVVIEVLANDDIPPGGESAQVSAIVREPTSGSATITDRGTTITFEAPTDFAGTEFIYEITQDRATSSATVVVSLEDAPCGDVTLTPAEGGAALEAAIVAANRCPGPQTIWLERGQYITPFDFTAIDDDLTIVGLDPDAKPEIVNSITGTAASTFRVNIGVTFEMRSLRMIDPGASSTFVYALNATVMIDDVDMIGSTTREPIDSVGSVRGDGAAITIRNSTISDADATAILGTNGTTLVAEFVAISTPEVAGIDVDTSVDLRSVNVTGSAGVGVTGTNVLEAVDSSFTESKVGLDLTSAALVDLNRVSISDNTLGLRLVDSTWIAQAVTFDNLERNCDLSNAPLTDLGDNFDSDNSCFPRPNQQPVAVADDATAAPGTTTTIDVLTNDSDPDGDVLTITSTTSPNATVAADGLSIEYTAPSDFTGELFSYTVDDGFGGTASADVRVDLSCPDVTLTAADGGTALAAAVAAADVCPGAQTIFLEPGNYVLRGQLIIDDELSIVGSDPASPAIITFNPPNANSAIYAFFVNAGTQRFRAANVHVVGGPLIAVGFFRGVDVELDNLSYVGGRAQCTQSTPTSIRVDGGTMLLRNSEIVDGNCAGIHATNAAQLTVAQTEIVNSGGHGIRATDTPVTVNSASIHGSRGEGIWTNSANLVEVDDSLVYANTAHGIRAEGGAAVTNSWIGLRPDGAELVPAGNGTHGVVTSFGDLTLTNTVVAHNGGAGVWGSDQANRTTTIADSVIRDNASQGLVAQRTPVLDLTRTTLTANSPNCAVGTSTTFSDGGGNSSDDDSCPFDLPNTDPTAQDDEVTAAPGATISIDVLANDSDADGDPLTIASTTSTNAAVASDGRSIEYNAPGDFVGEEFRYTIDDGRGGTASADVQVDVECADITLAAASGSSALADAVAAANTCPGPQTIFLEPGAYEIRSSLLVHDELTVEGTDPTRRAVIGAPSVTGGSIAYAFLVGAEAARFSVANVEVQGARGVVFGHFTRSAVELDNIVYRGAQAACSVTLPSSMLAIGGSLEIRNSEIIDGNCSGVATHTGAELTIVDSEIHRTAGYGVRGDASTVVVTGSRIHANDGPGVWASGPLTVDGSYVFDNTGNGVQGSSAVTVTNSGIGVLPDGETAGPNGAAGISSVFADLVIDNTVIANNDGGVQGPQQAGWSVDITNATIRDNASFGLQLATGSTGRTISGSELAGNDPNCDLQIGAVLVDGGGNTSDDDSCPFGRENQAPTISFDPTTLETTAGSQSQIVATVTDPDTPLADVTVTAEIQDPDLGSAVVSGTGATRLITVTTPDGVNGASIIVVTLSDGESTGDHYVPLVVIDVPSCLTDLVGDAFGAAMFPIRITEACVVPDDEVPDGVSSEDIFVEVTGEFVLGHLGDLAPTITIGDVSSTPQSPSQFTFTAVIDPNGNITPWDLGPIGVEFENASFDGLVFGADFTIAGYDASAFDGTIAGLASADVDLPGVATGTVAATLGGFAYLDDNGDYVIDLQIAVSGNATGLEASNVPFHISSFAAELAVDVRTQIDNDAAEPVSGQATVVLNSLNGTGTIALIDGDQELLSLDVTVGYDDSGTWQFDLEPSSPTGLQWFELRDAAGTIEINTRAVPLAITGSFSADAYLDLGDVGLEPIGGVTVTASHEGNELRLGFSGSGSVPAWYAGPNAGGDPIFTATNMPWSLSGGMQVDLVSGVASLDGLAVAVGPTTATLFPGLADSGFAVEASSVTATFDGTAATATAASVNGTFGPTELEIDGPVELQLGVDATVLLQVPRARLVTGETVAEVFDVTVFSDGTVVTAGGCVEHPAEWLDEQIGVGDLVPVDIDEICVLGGTSAPQGVPSGATYAVVSGSYDLSALDGIDPVVRIGDGPENTFVDVAVIRLATGEWKLWNTGIVSFGFAVSNPAGVRASGSLDLGGYTNGVFDPAIAGAGSASLNLPGVVTTSLAATIDGTFTTIDTTATLTADVTIEAAAGADVPDLGLVSLDEFDAELDLSISAARTPSGEIIVDVTTELESAAGAGRISVASDAGDQVIGGEVTLDYTQGLWTVGVTGDATAGDLEWFTATGFDGNITIRPGAIDGFAVEGTLVGAVAVDFDGEDNGAGAINVAAEAEFAHAAGVIDVAFRATNPAPLDFTLDELLTLDDASIEITGSASYDVATQVAGPFDLAVTFDALGASLFEFTDDQEDGGQFAVAVVSPQGRLDGSGLTVTTAGIAGRFADENVTVGATTMMIKKSEARYVVFRANTAVVESNGTTVTVSDVVVWSDGAFESGGICAENDEGLLGETFAVGGVVPFDITSVCVLDGDLVDGEPLPDDVIYAQVAGFVDLSALDDYNPVLEIGPQSSDGTGSITVSVIRSSDGTITPWDAGPVALGIGPVEANGLAFTGRIDLGGYVNGDFNGAVVGEFDASLALDGVAAAELHGDVVGTIDDDAGTLNAQASVEAAGTAGDSSASFIELTELNVLLDISLSASHADDTGWSTTGEVTLVSATGSGSLALIDDDGGAGFGASMSVGYEAGVWELNATGAATGPGDWLAFGEVGGTISIDTNDGFQVEGGLDAAATVDIDGDGANAPVALAASVDFANEGSVLTATFSSTASSPASLSVDPVFEVSDLALELSGSAMIELDGPNGIQVLSFDLAATASASQASLFAGLDNDAGFSVVATELAGRLDGTGLTLSVEGITGQFGPDVELEVGAATMEIRFDPDEVYEVVRVGFAELTVDENTTVTVSDVAIYSDGEVTFGDACIANADGLIGDTLGLAGILPFEITEACATTDGDQTFYAVSGTFDLSGLDGLFGEDSMVTLTVGDAAADASTGTFSFELVDDEDGIRPWNFGPFDLEVTGMEAGPFGASMDLYLGGYQSGQLTGLYAAGEVPAEGDRAVLLGGSFDVTLDVEADSADVGAGIGAELAGYAVSDGSVNTLVISGRLEGSGRVLVDNFGIAVENLGADFGVQLQLDTATGELAISDPSFGDNASAERLFLGLGFVTLEATGVDLFRSPGEVVQFDNITLAFTDDAGALEGWSGSVDDVSVRYSDEHGVEVCAGPQFATAITAGDDPDLFSWLPLSISDASFEIPETTPPTDGSCDSVLDRLGNFADATITTTLSLAIGGPDESIIDASVEAVTIEVPLLVDYAEWFASGAQGNPPQFPVTGLQGASFGLAPTDFGPLTLGGQIGIGFVLDENNQPVWYGRMAATAQWNNIGLSLDIGLSQLGPMWATIATPITIPLGPTGFTISGIGGGLLFDEAARLPSIDIGCVAAGGEEDPDSVPDGEGCVDSLALVRLPAFELTAPRNNDDILAAVRAKAAEVGGAAGQGLGQQVLALLPKQMTLYVQGSINHATGLIDGTVKLGANIDIAGEGVIPDLAILGKGEVSFVGFEAGELGLILDYANPLDPSIAVAIGVPGDGTLASFFPGEATFGGTYVTTGLYSGPILVARELVRDPSVLPGGNQVMNLLAQRLEADRTRPLAVFVLDANRNGVVDLGEDSAIPEITGGELADRLEAMFGVTDPNFEDQIADDAVFLAKLAEVLVADVFDALANGAPQPPTAPPQPPLVNPDDAVAAFLELARNTMLGADRAIDFVLETADPGFEIQGEAGLNLFGFPLGPQNRIVLGADKDKLYFDFSGSLGMMTNALTAALIQDDTTISFVAPWDLDGLVAAGLDGQLPDALPLDPINGDWAAGFDSHGLVAGLPFTSVGFVAPAGQAEFVTQKLVGVDFEPGYDPSKALETEGGAFFDLNLSIPRMFTDPADLLDKAIADDCFDFDFENVFANLQNFPVYQACIEALTAVDPLGSAQFYAPNPGNALIDALTGLEFSEDGLPPEFVPEVLSAFDGWYMRGRVNQFELFGFPVIDTESNPDNGTFIVDQTGVKFALQTKPFLTQVGDDSYQLNVRLPFLSGEGQPLPVVFDVVDGPVGPLVVPRLGIDTEIDRSQIDALLDGLGMGSSGFGSLDEVTLRAFTPGYDHDGDDLQRSGGVQLTATVGVDGLFGLVDAPPSTTATMALTLTPPSTGNLLGADVNGTLTLNGPATIGSVTLKGGTFTIDYDGDLVVTFAGDASIPDVGEVSVSGTIDVFGLAASFTIAGDSVRVGSLEVSGKLTLSAGPGSWSIAVAGIDRSDAMAAFDGWPAATAKSIMISNTGISIEELALPDMGVKTGPVWVDDPTVSASFDAAAGSWSASLGGVVHATIGSDTYEIDLAMVDLDDFELPTGGDGSFEHTFSTPLSLGTLDLGNATLTVGRTANEVLYAELDALVTGSPLGLDGALQITNLRVDSTGAVSGTATLTLSEPVQTTIGLTISTVAVGATTVIEFRSGESWLRTNGSWSLDVASLPTVRLGPGNGSDRPVRLVSGTISRAVTKGGSSDLVSFDGVVKIEPIDAFVTVGGTYNLATKALDVFTSSESLRVGPLEFSGRIDVEASPTTWKLVIASGPPTATVKVDGWGTATINGITIDSDGSFELDLEFSDFGNSSSLVRINEPSLAASFVPGQELSVVVGGVASIGIDGPGGERPCVVLGNAHLFDDNDCFDLGDAIALDLPAGSTGNFSHTFSLPLAIGVFDFGTVSATVERYGDGYLAFEVSATATAAVGPFALTLALDGARFVRPPTGSANLFGSGSATISGPGVSHSFTGSLRVQSERVRIDLGDFWLRSDGGWGAPSPVAPPALFTRAQPDIEVVRDFDDGGTTQVFFSVWIDEDDNVDLDCTIDGSSINPWSVTSARHRFRSYLGEGNHVVDCDAELDLPGSLLDRTETRRFDISVVRDIPLIGFAQPHDFAVALMNPNSAGLIAVEYPEFFTTNATALACDPTAPALLGLGTHVIECTASNPDSGASPVTRSFSVDVNEPFLMGTIGFFVPGDSNDEKYAEVGRAEDDGSRSGLDLDDNGAAKVTQGEEVVASGEDSKPESEVRAGLFSERYDAGSTIVDAQGRWSVVITIPADFPPGEHRIEIRSTDRQGRVRADYLPIVVAAAASDRPTAPAPQPVAPSTGAASLESVTGGSATIASPSVAPEVVTAGGEAPLAHTGTETRWLLQYALIFLGAGAWLAGTSRRSRRRRYLRAVGFERGDQIG